MKNLENKAIIITGAAMGLGLAAAKELAARGANLTLVDYNEKGLADAKVLISKEHLGVKIITVAAPTCTVGSAPAMERPREMLWTIQQSSSGP